MHKIITRNISTSGSFRDYGAGGEINYGPLFENSLLIKITRAVYTVLVMNRGRMCMMLSGP